MMRGRQAEMQIAVVGGERGHLATLQMCGSARMSAIATEMVIWGDNRPRYGIIIARLIAITGAYIHHSQKNGRAFGQYANGRVRRCIVSGDEAQRPANASATRQSANEQIERSRDRANEGCLANWQGASTLDK